MTVTLNSIGLRQNLVVADKGKYRYKCVQYVMTFIGYVNQFVPENDKPIVFENIQVRLRETKEEADLTIHRIEISTVMEYANVPVKPEVNYLHNF